MQNMTYELDKSGDQTVVRFDGGRAVTVPRGTPAQVVFEIAGQATDYDDFARRLGQLGSANEG